MSRVFPAKVSRHILSLLRELRGRQGVRTSALAVQEFTRLYAEGHGIVPYAGDFRIGAQGRVSLREARRRATNEREALRVEAHRVHQLLDRALLTLAERGKAHLSKQGARHTQTEGYERSTEALKGLYGRSSTYPLHISAGASKGGVSDEALEAAALLMREVVAAMSERHDQDMEQEARRVRGEESVADTGIGMDGDDTDGDDEDQSEPDSSAEPTTGDEKLSKEDVDYKYAPDQSKSCGTCWFFVEPSGCQIVEGVIRPVDVCSRWRGAEE